jgi:hypothetical protein
MGGVFAVSPLPKFVDPPHSLYMVPKWCPGSERIGWIHYRTVEDALGQAFLFRRSYPHFFWAFIARGAWKLAFLSIYSAGGTFPGGFPGSGNTSEVRKIFPSPFLWFC